VLGVLCQGQNLGHLRGAAPRLSPELELETSVLFYLINLGVRAEHNFTILDLVFFISQEIEDKKRLIFEEARNEKKSKLAKTTTASGTSTGIGHPSRCPFILRLSHITSSSKLASQLALGFQVP